MLNGSLGIGVILTASDLASGTIKAVAKEFAGLDDQVSKSAKKFAEAFGKKFGDLGAEPSIAILKEFTKGVGVASIGVAGLAAAFKLADSAGLFQHQLAELEATTKLTGDQVDIFKKQALSLGAEGKVGPEEVSKLFRELADSALTGNEALNALKPTVDLVAASFGRLSPQQAGGLMAKTLEAFPQLAGNATEAADMLARAFKSGLKPEEIAQAMHSAGKDARMFGGSLERVLETMGGLKAAGYAVGNLSQQMVIAASRAPMFQRGMNDVRRSLMDTGVTAESLAEKERGTWEGMKRSISTSLGALAVDFGLVFEETLRPILSGVATIVHKVVTAFVELSPATKKAFSGLFVFGSIGLIIGGLASAIGAITPLLWGIASAMAPVIAIGAAIAGVGYLIYKAWESDFGGIRTTIEEVFGKVKLVVLSLVELFTTGEISGALADDLGKAENEGVLDFVEAISEAVASIREYWEDVGPDIIETFQNISEVATPIIKTISGLFGTLTTTVGGLAKAIAGLFSGDFNTIVRGLTDVVNSGIDILNSLARAYNNTMGKLTGVEFSLMDHVTGAQLAEGVGGAGAGKEFLDAEKERQARLHPGSDKAPSNIPSGAASATATTGGVSASAATTIADSRPPGSGGPITAYMAPEVAKQFADAMEQTIHRRPIYVNGHLELDGMIVADWLARNRRDQRAGAGQSRFGPRVSDK